MLSRGAEFASSTVLRHGAKVVVLQEMLTGRVRVHLASEVEGDRFVPVDPSEPVERSKLHVVQKEDDRHGK